MRAVRAETIVTLWALAPTAAAAQTLEGAATQRFFSLTRSDRIFDAQLRYPEIAGEDTRTETSYQLAVVGALSGRPTDVVGLRLGIDTGLLGLSDAGLRFDGGSASDRFRETLFLGTSWVDLLLGASGLLQVRVGKLRPEVGDGLIFDAYAFGLFVDVDLTLPGLAPVAGRLLAVFPSGRLVRETFERPLLEARFRVEPSAHTRLSVFSAWHLDSGGTAPVLAPALVRGRVEALVATLDEADRRCAGHSA